MQVIRPSKASFEAEAESSDLGLWKDEVATLAALTAITTDPVGAKRYCVETGSWHRWTGATWVDQGATAHSHTNKVTLDAIEEALTTALKADYDDAVSKEHEHSNKATLDNIEEALTTALKSDYDDAVTKAHEHSNMTTLNAIEEALTTALKSDYDDAVTKAHEHSNKSTLDNIEEALTTALKSGYDDAVSKAHDVTYWGTKQIDETGLDTNQVAVYNSTSGKWEIKPYNPFSQILFADQLENPTSSDWAVNALAPLIADSNNSGIKVRRFDDTTEEGVGFTLQVPSVSTNIKFKLSSRAETAPGAAKTVDWKVYYREIPDNGAVGSWSNVSMTHIDIPTNENFQSDEEEKTLTSLSMNAGSIYQFELTRDVGGTDDLVGDWTLFKIEVEFS